MSQTRLNKTDHVDLIKTATIDNPSQKMNVEKILCCENNFYFSEKLKCNFGNFLSYNNAYRPFCIFYCFGILSYSLNSFLFELIKINSMYIQQFSIWSELFIRFSKRKCTHNIAVKCITLYFAGTRKLRNGWINFFYFWKLQNECTYKYSTRSIKSMKCIIQALDLYTISKLAR